MQFRMLPSGYLAQPYDQQTARRQPGYQMIQYFPALPAAEINQQVLAKNHIHIAHWHTADFERIKTAKTHAQHQLAPGLILSAFDLGEISVAQLRLQFAEPLLTVTACTGGFQRHGTDINTSYGKTARRICPAQLLGCGYCQ